METLSLTPLFEIWISRKAASDFELRAGALGVPRLAFCVFRE